MKIIYTKERHDALPMEIILKTSSSLLPDQLDFIASFLHDGKDYVDLESGVEFLKNLKHGEFNALIENLVNQFETVRFFTFRP